MWMFTRLRQVLLLLGIECDLGVSRYLEIPGVRVDKTEDLTDFSSFDYLLMHDKEEAGEGFEVIGKEQCFAGMNWRKGRIVLQDCIYLMKRK